MSDASKQDELARELESFARDACYRVDAVLKETSCERTERVFFTGAHGGELGPFVRKRIAADAGIGDAYEVLWEAQRAGRRFLHLPRMIDCHRVGGELVVVMEHVAGATLDVCVRERGAGLRTAAAVFPGVVDAVAELHAAFDPPLIHRDLTPGNVIVAASGATLVDFGIARVFDADAACDTHRFGTRAFAPPEQFGFRQTDVRSDVYALGMLLAFCLVGRSPEPSALARDLAEAGVATPLRACVLRACAFDPAARFASARALADAFARACAEAGAHPSASDAAAGTRADACEGTAAERPSAALAPLEGKPLAVAVRAQDGIAYAAASVPAPASQTVPNGGRRPAWDASGARFALGCAWDACIAFALVLLGAVCIQNTIAPRPTDALADAALPLRAACYGALYLLMIVPAGALVCARRPLARIAPRLSRVPMRTQVLLYAVLEAIGFVIVGVTGNMG